MDYFPCGAVENTARHAPVERRRILGALRAKYGIRRVVRSDYFRASEAAPAAYYINILFAVRADKAIFAGIIGCPAVDASPRKECVKQCCRSALCRCKNCAHLARYLILSIFIFFTVWNSFSSLCVSHENALRKKGNIIFRGGIVNGRLL